MTRSTGSKRTSELPVELQHLQRCADLMTELEAEILTLEWEHSAGKRSVEWLRSRFRDVLDAIEVPDAL